MISLTAYDFNAHIHMYKWKELNIVLDVNSGAIHILDDVAYLLMEKLIECQGDFPRAIKLTNKIFSPEETREAVTEIERAFEEEALFTPEEDLYFDLSQLEVKALCLNIAHACNMKCKYCFASQGDFGMKSELMSFDIGKKALDFLIQQSGGKRNLEVDFFGGEPLLNVDVVKGLVYYGRELEKKTGKHFNFTLTTNALLLDDEIMDFIIDNEISIILSMDGRPEINDQHRILNNGMGTYDLILPNIKKMVARNPVSYYIRGTFTKKNLDFARDAEHIIEAGFDSISLEPAVGVDNPFAIHSEDLPRVLEEYENLTELLLRYHKQGKEIHFFHYNLDLQKGPCIAKRTSGCGAGNEYLVITPNGDIYPCHQFVGEEQFYMGNINEGKLDGKVRSIFRNNRLQDKECRYCWARYFCGGGCHANAYHSSKDISKPDQTSCIMHKKRIEGAIYLDIEKYF